MTHLLSSSANPTEESTRFRLLSELYPLASTFSASIDDTAASYVHSPSFPIPSPFVDRRRLTMRFFTAREGCGGLGAILVPDRVAAMSFPPPSPIDCARRLLRSGGSQGGQG